MKPDPRVALTCKHQVLKDAIWHCQECLDEIFPNKHAPDSLEDGREEFAEWMKSPHRAKYLARPTEPVYLAAREAWQAAWTARAARERELEMEIRADERNRMQTYIEKRARDLMLEHYDADLYKRALEDHLKYKFCKDCGQPIKPGRHKPDEYRHAQGCPKDRSKYSQPEEKL